MNGAHALLRSLRAMGVERIFASPGSDWAPLWEALAAAPEGGKASDLFDAGARYPQYISSRHEEMDVFNSYPQGHAAKAG